SALAQQGGRNPGEIPITIERCPGIVDAAARLQCYQRALAQTPSPGAAPQSSASSWRLVRATDPRGGSDKVSMMHTADTARSDLDLAGLMLRCSDNGPLGGAQVLVVVLTPFPPRAHPEVAIVAGSQQLRFDAAVVPPGAELLLPQDAHSLVDGTLTSLHAVDITI